MTTKEIETLRDRQNRIAERCYQNYQETGMTRYDREYRKATDIVELCERTLSAADDHQLANAIKADIFWYGFEAIQLAHDWDEEAAKKFVSGFAAYAKSKGARDPWG